MSENMVIECCPTCDNEIEMRWNVDKQGYQAFCPICGNPLMLCDECEHLNGEFIGGCDYSGINDTCKHKQNREKPKEAIIMNQNTFWVMLFALRYASPRNTVALRIVSGYIIEHLDMMTTNQKEILKQEIIGLSPVEKRYAKRYLKELCDRLEIR